jgi:hypothetical protein
LLFRGSSSFSGILKILLNSGKILPGIPEEISALHRKERGKVTVVYSLLQ